MKYECDVIRDLMSLCIDGLASEMSERIVKEHLQECKACMEEWKLMNKDFTPPPKEPVPEDIQRYRKTARRIQKHRLITTALTFGIAVLSSWWVYTNPYAEGIRFTPSQAAAAFYYKNDVKLNAIDEYVTSENNNRILWMTDGKGYFYVTAVHRNLHTYGLWEAYSGAKYWYKNSEDESAGLYYFEYSSNEKPGKWLISCYAEDPNVAKVTLTAFRRSRTQLMNENRLAIFEYPIQTNDAQEIFTGFAEDMDGKVIYELRFEERKGYYWEKTD